MRYTTFGRHTGLRVSEYALGTGNFGKGGFEATSDLDEAPKILESFAEAGGNLIDGADSYNYGQSEEFIADFIAANRDHFVVATKFAIGATRDPSIQMMGNSRKAMMRSVEGSLKRLRTDYIDIYWAHLPDTVTPIEEIMMGFDDLVRSGKIIAAGLSNFPAWHVARAATMAEIRGWAPMGGIQIEYSLAERSGDRELLPMANALGLGVTMWSPLGGGLLTGKYRRGETGRLGQRRRNHTENTPEKVATVDAGIAVAEEIHATPTQVALAWLRSLGQRANNPAIPIVGPRTVAQLEEQLGGLEIELSDEHFERLDTASALAPGAPHDQIAQVRPRLIGGDQVIDSGVWRA
jgi:aryl-alcohol dehydrogenase-like predicted oxidoreductase